MSYLDNTAITIDGILTKRGREKFSQGNFNVTKFALADDEIDYDLYDKTHPSGSDFYSIAIENLPMLEAIPDGNKMMRFKLITLPKGTTQIPLISIGISSVRLRAAYNNYPGGSLIITPSTVNGLNETLGYTATIQDTRYVDLLVGSGIAPVTPGDVQENQNMVAERNISSSTGKSLIGKTFILKAKSVPNASTTYSTTLVIVGNETGGSVTVPVYIRRDEEAIISEV